MKRSKKTGHLSAGVVANLGQAEKALAKETPLAVVSQSRSIVRGIACAASLCLNDCSLSPSSPGGGL